ncbi:4Fe-4S dicluster domain-containing protein [Methanolobus halotolerans]|uniref:Ferredoxin n=1 Tax=Methanolobus halotolerans TaxID=2052935 RepID=A0A4E0PW36_9EURY|nr:4Fe-4S dicluster domain-containing protein [Methanolobus halotolerans]TGC08494.1 ferredoxin [Methanolobus halotolerans]
MDGKEGHIAVIGCRKCGKCNHVCLRGALYMVDGVVRVDYGLCTMCMACTRICPNKALIYIE